jgi:hypothetical protein
VHDAGRSGQQRKEEAEEDDPDDSTGRGSSHADANVE